MHNYDFRKTVVFAIMLIPAPTIHNDTKWQLCWGGGGGGHAVCLVRCVCKESSHFRRQNNNVWMSVYKNQCVYMLSLMPAPRYVLLWNVY